MPRTSGENVSPAAASASAKGFPSASDFATCSIRGRHAEGTRAISICHARRTSIPAASATARRPSMSATIARGISRRENMTGV